MQAYFRTYPLPERSRGLPRLTPRSFPWVAHFTCRGPPVQRRVRNAPGAYQAPGPSHSGCLPHQGSARIPSPFTGKAPCPRLQPLHRHLACSPDRGGVRYRSGIRPAPRHPEQTARSFYRQGRFQSLRGRTPRASSGRLRAPPIEAAQSPQPLARNAAPWVRVKARVFVSGRVRHGIDT